MFKIAEYDLEQIGRCSTSSIRCKVTGFWSGDSISIYIHRDLLERAAKWKFTLSNSSGGRDTKEVESDAVAYKNFAAAMNAMCDLILELEGQVPVLEQHYQAMREELRLEREAEKAAEQAKFDADLPLGADTAEVLVNSMTTTNSHIKGYRRGQDRPVMVNAVTRMKTKYYMGGSVISKKDLIAQLAEFSSRTAIHTN